MPILISDANVSDRGACLSPLKIDEEEFHWKNQNVA